MQQEFREALESLENNEQLTQLFSAKTLGVDESEVKAQPGAAGDDDDDEEEDDDGEVNISTIKSTFEHDKDAVDFSEINDLAVDNTEQEMFSQRYLQKGLSAVKAAATTAMRSGSQGVRTKSRLDSMDEDYDAEDSDGESKASALKNGMPALPSASQQPALTLLQRQQLYLQEEQGKQQQQIGGVGSSKPLLPPSSLPGLPGVTAAVPVASATVEPVDVRKLYPAFEENKILKFSELFNTKRPKRFPHSRAKPGSFILQLCIFTQALNHM